MGRSRFLSMKSMTPSATECGMPQSQPVMIRAPHRHGPVSASREQPPTETTIVARRTTRANPRNRFSTRPPGTPHRELGQQLTGMHHHDGGGRGDHLNRPRCPGGLKAESLLLARRGKVMTPGLEKRALFFPPLEASLHLTPGYFDAPGTTAICQYGGPPAVTLVFCTLQGMVESNRELAPKVLSLYSTIIRRSLLATGGYECQEQQGSYMIAFHSSTDALEWCLMVQEIIYEIRWTEAMMALPNMLTASQGHRFSGPRVNMGIFTGVPSKVMPHSTTGRADYFGPLVNRAARLCHGAAHGGQGSATVPWNFPRESSEARG
eukprot:gene26740-4306_t